MSQASPPADAIARELAALGEDAPSAAEFALVDGDAQALDDDAAVASVARLTELAEPLEFDDLSELEVHRVWRQVEHQVEHQVEREAPSPSAPASPRRWLFAAAGLAAAAAVALIVIPRDRQAPAPAVTQLSAAEVSAQGDLVRSALAGLDDGRSDTARAQDRLAAYQQQLEERGG